MLTIKAYITTEAVILTLWDGLNPANIATIGAAPTLTISGQAVPLTAPVWQGTTAANQPWVVYPYANGYHAATGADGVAAIPAGAITSTSATIGAGSYPTTNIVGLPFPSVVSLLNRDMAMGYNMARVGCSQPIELYNNLVMAGSDGWVGNLAVDEDGYPSNISGESISRSCRLIDRDGTRANGHPSFTRVGHAGHHTVKWSGRENVELGTYVPNRTAFTTISNDWDGTDKENTAVIDCQIIPPLTPDDPFTPLDLLLRIHNPTPGTPWTIPAQNRDYRIYGPNGVVDSGVTFSPHVFRQMGSARSCQRWMDMQFTNASNICRSKYLFRGDRNPISATQAVTLTGTITDMTIRPTASHFLDQQTAQIIITCQQPHELETGVYTDHIVLSTPFTLSDGTVVTVADWQSVLEKIDDHRFAINASGYAVLAGGSGGVPFAIAPGTTIATGHPIGGSWSLAFIRPMPLEDMIAFSNQARGIPWLNIPPWMPLAEVAIIAEYVMTHSLNGAYIELSNETWNSGFTQNYVFRRFSTQTYGVDLAALSYAPMALAVHDVFVAAAQAHGKSVGPNGFIRRVYGTQTNGVATRPICDRLQALGRLDAMDCIATAVYFSNGPPAYDAPIDPAIGALTAAWSTEMLAYLLQLYMEFGDWGRYISDNYGILRDEYGYTGAEVVVYEGGPDYMAVPGTPQDGDRSNKLLLHPFTRLAYLRLLDKVDRAGAKLFNPFEFGAQRSTPGWGSYIFTVDIMPGPGDGSAGGFNNRSNYDDTVHLESVLAGACDQFGLANKNPCPPVLDLPPIIDPSPTIDPGYAGFIFAIFTLPTP